MSNPNEEDKILVDKKFIEEASNDKQAIANLTEEIKELRRKKQEAEELAKAVAEKKPEADDIDTKVEQILSKKEQEILSKAKEEAIEEFRNSNPIFSEDNDPGNLKFKAFQKELNKFKLDDLKSKEEVKSRLSEVYEFMNRGAKENSNNNNQFAATKKNGGSYQVSDDVILTDKEKKLIKMQNINIDTYLKMKEKRPHYINNFLRFLD